MYDLKLFFGGCNTCLHADSCKRIVNRSLVCSKIGCVKIGKNTDFIKEEQQIL
jgi:hypothetical protein